QPPRIGWHVKVTQDAEHQRGKHPGALWRRQLHNLVLAMRPTQRLLPAWRNRSHVLERDGPAQPIGFGHKSLCPATVDAPAWTFGRHVARRLREHRVSERGAYFVNKTVRRE